MFTDLHEIFFATFPSELHTWSSRLAESKISTQSDRPAEWTPEETLNERLMHLVGIEEDRFIVGFHQQVQKER